MPGGYSGELARFFGYSHDLLAVLDGRGRVLLASPSTERILGYRPDTLAGQRLLGLVHPDDLARVRLSGRQLAREQAVSDVDCQIRHRDGRWIPMRWSISTQGPRGRMYGVGRDRRSEVRRERDVRSREAAELRLETAAELHDGVLQTLTATGLQLEVARRLLAQDVAAAEQVLVSLRDAVAAEQRELRLYVDELKLDRAHQADRTPPLRQRIAEMLDRVCAIWGVDTSLEGGLESLPDPESERRIFRIIQEAVVNAARHGHAHSVAVRLELVGSDITIQLHDDGQGFPFLGDYGDRELKDQRLGPLSLKRRVTQSGGRMAIRSTPEGATIQITLPLAEEVDA